MSAAQEAPLVAVLGVGQLGGALLDGLLGAGHDPARLVGAVRDPEAAQRLAGRLGIAVHADARMAARVADVLLVAVKPTQVPGLLQPLSAELRSDHTIVSFAAGWTTAALGVLVGSVPVVRAMTNTPVRARQAMTVLAPGPGVNPERVAMVAGLLTAVGRVRELDEQLLDAVTALSGSGPAYVFLVVEALIDAGVLQGLPRPVASELAVQTLAGAAALLHEDGPAQLRAAVTSPGGTTAAGLRALEDGGLRSAFYAAIQAATSRSAALGGATMPSTRAG